ncbi:MAG TPA: hypothetical protein VGY58_10935 [Gemmataceae bacterium]|nr:hypothetical protein [Gemmataceae bacterium]
MNSSMLLLSRVLLWIASLSHIVIGGGIMLSPEFQRTMASFYGAEVDWTPQFVYILRPLGAFMFMFGLLLAVAAVEPWKHRLIVYGLCGVLLLRVVQRLALQQDIESAFHVSASRNLGMAALFLIEAIAILVLLHGSRKSTAPDAVVTRPLT